VKDYAGLTVKLAFVCSEGRTACANANGGAELLQPLHYEENCRYQTAHIGEQWEVAEASKVSEATCTV